MDRRPEPGVRDLARSSSRPGSPRRTFGQAAWLDAAMPAAHGSAAMSRRLAAATGVAMATLAAVPAATCASAPAGSATVAAARRPLRSAEWQTTYPAGWRARLDHVRVGGAGISEYSISSTRQALNADAIPPAGGIGLTIYLYPVRLLTGGARLPRRLGQAALRLIFDGVVGIPRPARYVTTTESARAATLGRRPAARITYLYEYGDDYNLNLQDDVVALHGRTIVQVELDTAPALRRRGERALTALLRAWQWRSGPATMAR